MNYQEFIARVFKDSSVNSVAKRLGIPQRNMDRYRNGEAIPSWSAAKAMANEVGISAQELIDMLAAEEEARKEVVERRRIELPTFALRKLRTRKPNIRHVTHQVMH